MEELRLNAALYLTTVCPSPDNTADGSGSSPVRAVEEPSDGPRRVVIRDDSPPPKAPTRVRTTRDRFERVAARIVLAAAALGTGDTPERPK